MTDRKLKPLLDEIADRTELLTDWERDFIESVGDQLSNGRELSDKQRSIISRIYEQRVLGW